MNRPAVDVAVIGAGTPVGRSLLNLLAQRRFPLGRLHALEATPELGDTIAFGEDDELAVEPAAQFDFSRVGLVFITAGAESGRRFGPPAAAAGSLVIDASGAFEDRDDIPLVVPEVNPRALAACERGSILASPADSVVPMAVIAASLAGAAAPTAIHVSTYQAVSTLGVEAIQELARQSAALLGGKESAPRVFDKQIAFNVIPRIGRTLGGGETAEEARIVRQLRLLLGRPRLPVAVTAVQVPVFFGHSASMHLTFESPIAVEHARERLAVTPGVVVMDAAGAGGYPTAAGEAAMGDAIYVGRLRQVDDEGRALGLWVVCDNVRKGSALNCVQIAEILVKEHF